MFADKLQSAGNHRIVLNHHVARAPDSDPGGSNPDDTFFGRLPAHQRVQQFGGVVTRLGQVERNATLDNKLKSEATLETRDWMQLRLPAKVVDIRLIAATNRNLEQGVKEGWFREDLYYRLNVFTITMPPLRSRVESIPLLAHHFLEKASAKLKKKIVGIEERAIKAMVQHPWSGNIREMQNIIERAMITSRDGRLNLDRALPESVNAMAVAVGTNNSTIQRVRTAKELEELERNNIIAALKAAEWKIAGEKGAAQLLGVKPTTLSSRMKVLNIERKG